MTTAAAPVVATSAGALGGRVRPDAADVEHLQGFLGRVLNILGQQDGSGTGAERRLAAHKLAELIEEAALHQKIQKGAGFAAGNHDGVYGIQLLRLAHQCDLSTQPLQHSLVRFVVTLNCKNANLHELQNPFNREERSKRRSERKLRSLISITS